MLFLPLTTIFPTFIFPQVHYQQQFRALIDKSPIGVVEASIKAGIGQATLYESLRGKYVLSHRKASSVLDAIGASPAQKSEILRLREEVCKSRGSKVSRKRKKVDSTRERDKIISFFRRHEIEVEEDSVITSLLHAVIREKTVPILAPGQIEDYERVFGSALKAMLGAETDQSIVVSYIVEAPPEWDGVERFGVHLMNPNDALEALQRLSVGKPLSAAGSNPRLTEHRLYF